MSDQEPVIHHQVLKLKDNPFTQPAPSPIWSGATRRFLQTKHKTKQCHGNCWDGWRPPVAVRNCWWSATSTVATARCCLYTSLTPRRAQQDSHHTLPQPPSPGRGSGQSKLAVGQASSTLIQFIFETVILPTTHWFFDYDIGMLCLYRICL